ncbi:MAG: ribonuclease D [Gemmataceae bacterium]|nr:ribonuclease D [Gemmataceae bacterium]
MKEHLIRDNHSLKSCLESLSRASIIAFDTEFVSEESFRPELCLLQVATEEELFVIDPLQVEGLNGFWDILSTGQKVVIVHAGREEIRICQVLSGKQPGGIFDIQVAAGLLGLGYPSSYASLVQNLTGTRLSKQETLTDWRIRPLREEQIRYAFDDVRYLIPCWKKMSQRLEKLEREAWAGEEFAMLLAKVNLNDGESERWRKVKGAGSLDARKLAMLREIFKWREEMAAKRNRPVRAILRDDLIIEVVKRNPKEGSDLAHLRGIQPRDTTALFACLEKARAISKEELPEVEDYRQEPPQVQTIAQVLGSILADHCAREELTPGLVATTSDLRDLVRGKLEGNGLSPDNALADGWRKKHILPIFMAFLEGKSSLRLARVDRESPFEYDNHSSRG